MLKETNSEARKQSSIVNVMFKGELICRLIASKFSGINFATLGKMSKKSGCPYKRLNHQMSQF